MDGFSSQSQRDSLAYTSPNTNSDTGPSPVRKISYAIPCATRFRDAVLTLAEERSVNPGDLARSILLALPKSVVRTAPDPGEPEEHDRETIILKSGPSAGKPWRRKPRLQVRLPAGHDAVDIRKALGIALDLDAGECRITLESSASPSWKELAQQDREKISRLQVTLATVSFDPLPDGVKTRADALHILGFAPRSQPDKSLIRAKYRMLAAVFHPDSEFGDHARMSQINEAVAVLRDHTR